MMEMERVNDECLETDESLQWQQEKLQNLRPPQEVSSIFSPL